MTAPLPLDVYVNPSWWDLLNERVLAALQDATLRSAAGLVSLLASQAETLPQWLLENERRMLRDLLLSVPDLLSLLVDEHVAIRDHAGDRLHLTEDQVLALAGLRRAGVTV